MAKTVIIGGGVIGLSIARELHKRGHDGITVVDKSTCGEESSWAAGGMLGPQAESDHGGQFYDLCSESRDLYPTLAAELLSETGIDIELDTKGTLYVAFSPIEMERLASRYEVQRARGLTVEMLDAAEIRRREPFISPDVVGGLFLPNDWQVDNRKLIAALRKYTELNGIEIIENCEVRGVKTKDGKVVNIVANDREFDTENIIVCAGAWTSKLGLPLPEVVPVRGQIICYRTAKRVYEHVIYSLRGYIVPRQDGRVLSGSTSEFVGFSKGVTDDGVATLRAMAEEISPSLASQTPYDSWSGLRPKTADEIPVIGRIDGLTNAFAAIGHYRNGILLAPITANMIADRFEMDITVMPNRNSAIG
ncbi:MAG TPA: glycine oxidase ThiO [Pyrinomonadaceae bacterium]|nr:glycine oxidase ThiO [Pyrinomonadaceae bacterium]